MAGQVSLFPQQLPADRDRSVSMELASLRRRIDQVARNSGFIAKGSITGGGSGLIAPDAITTAEIAAGTITADDIYSGTVQANLIQATNIAANAITATHISAGAIDGKVITGATVQTSGSNPRVVMDSTGVYAVDVSGNVTFKADASTGKIITLAGIGGGNLLANASAEADIAAVGGWAPAVVGSSTTVRSAQTFAQHGSYVFSATVTTGTANAGVINQNARVPVQVGQTYTLSGYARSSSVSRNLIVSIVWFDNTGTEVSRVDNSAQNTSTTEWVRGVVTGQAPVGAATAEVRVRVTSAVVADGAHYFDGIQLEIGQIPTAFAPKPDEILPSTVTSDHIVDGTIKGSDITTVVADTITADNIYSGAIAANLIQATNIAANAILASHISAGALDAKTITGSTIRTASSGARVEMSGSSIKSYDGSGGVGLEIVPSHPAPSLTRGLGDLVTSTTSFAFWSNMTKSVFVPAGKTLIAVIGGEISGPNSGSGTGAVLAWYTLRPEIQGDVGDNYDFTIVGALQSAVLARQAVTVTHARTNTGSDATWSINVKIKYGNLDSGAYAPETIPNSGWILALVF